MVDNELGRPSVVAGMGSVLSGQLSDRLSLGPLLLSLFLLCEDFVLFFLIFFLCMYPFS